MKKSIRKSNDEYLFKIISPRLINLPDDLSDRFLYLINAS